MKHAASLMILQHFRKADFIDVPACCPIFAADQPIEALPSSSFTQ
jgi:hypothetical protein